MTSLRPLLLCTDLDRTLIPNGAEPESPGARERFRRFVAREGVTLAYVTGRHRTLVEEAVAGYGLPVPDYLIGDVGTSLWRVRGGVWEPVAGWKERIGADWAGTSHGALAVLLAGTPGLRLQEPEKQAPLKLSWYADAGFDPRVGLEPLRERLTAAGLRARLVWSVDEAAGVGLLDVLPEAASKYHAIEYLVELTGLGVRDTVFAGDSGNDLEVLASPIPAVLVANGHPDVRLEARRLAAAGGWAHLLYEATGGWGGMNGNYSAGILEGVAHFRPDLADFL